MVYELRFILNTKNIIFLWLCLSKREKNRCKCEMHYILVKAVSFQYLYIIIYSYTLCSL